MQAYHLLILLLIVVLMAGCKNNPISTDQLPQILYGQVVDSQGSSVADVNVHYIFQIPGTTLGKNESYNPTLSKVSKICPSTNIVFTIPTRSKATVKIFRWYTRDTVATLIDDTLDSGTHSITLNSTKMTNGFYIFQVHSDTFFVEKMMVFLNVDISTLVLADPLIKSNSSGAFELPYALLGFGIPISRTSAIGQTIDTVQISSTIQVVLCKTGYSTTTQSVTIDPAIGLKQTFVLRKL
jgi:hypothetical protein